MVSLGDVAASIVDGLMMGGLYGLVSVGLALIWGVMDVINFAHGDYMMLGALATYFLAARAGLDPLLAAPLVFGLVFVAGVLTQRAVINRILDAPLLTQIAATFAVLLIIRYGAQALFGPDTRILDNHYASVVYYVGPLVLPLPKLIAFTVSVAVAALLYLFLFHTRTGVALRATSQNREVAELMGINVRRMYDLAFGLGVGIAGVAGVVAALFQPVYPEMGAFYALIAFIAVVLGGFGSVFGAFIGAIIVGVTESVAALFINPAMKDVAAFILFIVIILVKPMGLFGKKM